MSFYIERSDAEPISVQGYRYKAPKASQKSYHSERSHLPARVDLRSFMTKIESQGDSNSCVANAVAGAYEYLLKRHWGDDGYDVSRLFIYFNARLEDDEMEDEGATIESVIEGLTEYGACSEETWPFDLDVINEEPSAEAYEEASNFLIEDVSLVPTRLEKWKQCLADGYPIVFGLQLYDSFDTHYKRKGLVSLPNRQELHRDSHAGHAMLCVGYSDRDKVFIVRNSWGRKWGDRGYCYIPYSYIINEKYNFGDSWIIRQIEALEVEEEIWDEEESLLEDLASVFYEMDDALYEQMLEEMADYPLELRVAHIMLHVAAADGEVSEAEEDILKDHLQGFIDDLGIDRRAKKVLKKAYRRIEDVSLLEESLDFLGAYVPNENLAAFVNILIEIADGDELVEDEEDFIYQIIQLWQLEWDG